MKKNARVHLGQTCLHLTMVVLLAAQTPGTSRAADVSEFPAPRSKDDPLFYDLNWPDVTKLQTVKDIPYAQYSCETLLREVLREGVLEKGWQERLVRVPAWIPKRSGTVGVPIDLDAYLYRQPFMDGVLHVCDTRQRLTVAFYRPGEGDFRDTPRKVFEEITPVLLKMKIPAEWMTTRKGTGDRLLLASGTYNMPGPDTPVTSATGWWAHNPNESTYQFSCSLGERLAVYGFHKLSVPGCDLNPATPLFRPASATASRTEQAIAFFEGLKVPTPADIPRIAKVLKSLPTLDTQDMRSRPYEFRVLARAKYSGYDLLIAAVKSATAAEHVALVTQALDALPQEHDLRGRAEDIQRAAVESLRKIGTTEARQALEKIAQTAKNPRLFRDSKEAILKAMPEREARRAALEEAQKRAQNPDAEPEKLEFYMRGLGRPLDPPEVRVLREILLHTRDHGIRAAAIRQLSKWIVDDADSRATVLQDMIASLSSPDPQVRQDAIRALGASGDWRALARLRPLFEDMHPSVRFAAAEATAQLLAWPKASLKTEKEPAYVEHVKNKIDALLPKLADLEGASKYIPKAP